MNLPFTKTNCRLIGLVALAICLAGAVYAEDNAPPAAAPEQAHAHILTTNDKLNIVVVQEPGLALVSRINAKGTINLTFIGEVHVAGLTVKQAQTAIEDAYRDGYLRNPQVIINVEDYAPREVFVTGEVRSPGKYQLPVEQIMTIDELVLKAGGFTDSAKGDAVRVTRKEPDGRTKVLGPFDVDGIIKGRKGSASPLVLQPGDSVNVDQRIF
jgi:polysaccharide export outer membrane protein